MTSNTWRNITRNLILKCSKQQITYLLYNPNFISSVIYCMIFVSTYTTLLNNIKRTPHQKRTIYAAQLHANFFFKKTYSVEIYEQNVYDQMFTLTIWAQNHQMRVNLANTYAYHWLLLVRMSTMLRIITHRVRKYAFSHGFIRSKTELKMYNSMEKKSQ